MHIYSDELEQGLPSLTDCTEIGDLVPTMRDGEARFVIQQAAMPAWEMPLRQWPALVIRTFQNLAWHTRGTDVTYFFDLLTFEPEGPVVKLRCYVQDRATGQEEMAFAWLNPTGAVDRRVLSGLGSVPVMLVYLFSFQNAQNGGELSATGGVGHLTRDLHASIAEILETTWDMTTQWPEARQRAEAEWASSRMTGETGATSHA